MEYEPIITVIVLTYNSSSTVIETLDSIRNQSYRNIELIIADDKSADDTANVCRKWIDVNSDRFVNCQVIVPESNTGTSANCNRGIKASHGEWIRVIGGDDLIPERALEIQIAYISQHDDIRILNGYCVNFKEEDGIMTQLPSPKKIDTNPRFYESTAQEQYQYLLRHYDFGITDGTLIHRSIYRDVTMYDENYSLIEDLPFWLTVTKAGIKYHYVDTPTMLYRIHDSVVHSNGEKIANQRFWDIRRRIICDMIKPNIPWYAILIRKKIIVDNIIYWFIFNVFHNKRSLKSRAILAILYKL